MTTLILADHVQEHVDEQCRVAGHLRRHNMSLADRLVEHCHGPQQTPKSPMGCTRPRCARMGCRRHSWTRVGCTGHITVTWTAADAADPPWAAQNSTTDVRAAQEARAQGTHLVALVDIFQPAQTTPKGLPDFKVASSAFVDMHMCVCNAVDVDNLETVWDYDVCDRCVVESNVLVLDHLSNSVSNTDGHVLECITRGKWPAPVHSAGPRARLQVNRTLVDLVEGCVVFVGLPQHASEQA
jgi:hypothetical protein